jgi:hypothetical protein
LTKEEKNSEVLAKGLVITQTITVLYDDQKNALKNVIGLDKLVDFAQTDSFNNGLVFFESSSEKELATNPITSSINRLESKIQYNSVGYPAEIVTERMFFVSSNAKHLKS